MKVEIWSDVMCPFCYIGKRRFEEALQQFPQSHALEVEWKSFQLDPAMKSMPGKNISEYLAESKGWTPEHAQQMNAQVTRMAQDAGLTYELDKAVVANSFDAHRFAHLAASQGKQDAAEERLFQAYFTEGKDIADPVVLEKLGEDIGLVAGSVKAMIGSQQYADAVRKDIAEAHAIGVSGVPFFVFNRQYAVSGAQSAEVFLQVLNKSWAAWKEAQPLSVVSGDAGEHCTPGGDC